MFDAIHVDFGRKDNQDDFGAAEFGCFYKPTGFHNGCKGSFGNPKMHYQGLPVQGEVFALIVANAAPRSPAFLLIGRSNRSWNGVRLPLPLGKYIRGTQCSLLVSPDIVLPTTTGGSTSNGVPSSAKIALRIPGGRVFEGVRYYFQWGIADRRAVAKWRGRFDGFEDQSVAVSAGEASEIGRGASRPT